MAIQTKCLSQAMLGWAARKYNAVSLLLVP